jgi:hypothetical protein
MSDSRNANGVADWMIPFLQDNLRALRASLQNPGIRHFRYRELDTGTICVI